MKELPAGLQVDHHAIQFVVVRLAVPLIDQHLIVLEGGFRILGGQLSRQKVERECRVFV